MSYENFFIQKADGSEEPFDTTEIQVKILQALAEHETSILLKHTPVTLTTLSNLDTLKRLYTYFSADWKKFYEQCGKGKPE